MSDESDAPSGPEPIPLSQARPVRPPTGKKLATPPAPPSKVKAYLVIGIIVTSVLLIAAIGWRLYVKFTTKVVPPRNVKVEWQNAYLAAKGANKELFENVEAKVWTKGETLTPADLENVKKQVAVLQKTSETYHELMELLRTQKKLDSAEAQDMSGFQLTLKTWIWDANGLLDPAAKPPKYGGLYIPLYSLEDRRSKASARLKEIKDKAQEIIARADAAEIEKTVKEVKSLEDSFAAIRDDFDQLDTDLRNGLTLPDLKKEQLQELAYIRENHTLAQMSFNEARQVRSQFPKVEPKDPTKEEPKPEPPKEPPKEEPPKEEPKKEPPKEEPKPEPKEEPKKEPPKEEPPK